MKRIQLNQLALKKRAVSNLQQIAISGGTQIFTKENDVFSGPTFDPDCGYVSHGPVVCLTGGATKCV